jgi:hypothetical protein
MSDASDPRKIENLKKYNPMFKIKKLAIVFYTDL